MQNNESAKNAGSKSTAPSSVRGALQSIGFNCALGYIFLRFSDLHEMIAAVSHVDTYLLYLFAPVALLAVILSGRLPYVFRQATARFWLGFAVWVTLAVPFSTWRGGSFAAVTSYLKVNFIMLLIVAALARTWRDCRKVIYTIAAAAVVDVIAAYVFLKPGAERLQLQWSGTIGNSNDLAAHLLLVLPFLLFVGLKPRVALPFRIVSFAVVAIGIFQILRTASRGALLALVASIFLLFIRGSAKQKLTVAAVAAVAMVSLAMLPSVTLTRLLSFSRSSSTSEEAMESSDIRQYELQRSIIETFTHPLFGVGPSQFPSFEGRSVKGGQGGWLETHNSFTQISSECGLPAIGLYVSALVSTFVLLSRIRKNAVGRYAREIRTAEFCIKIGLFAFTVAIFFVNFGYNFHIPAISGLVIGIWSVVVGQHRKLLRTARQTVKDADETDALKDSVEASFRMARASATISGSG